MDILFKEDKKIEFDNNEMFLGQINNYVNNEIENIHNELVFRLNGDTNIFKTIFDKKTNKSKTEGQKTKVNISHNFIRKPKNYKDYEYLLDYKNILKPEYLDL